MNLEGNSKIAFLESEIFNIFKFDFIWLHVVPHSSLLKTLYQLLPVKQVLILLHHNCKAAIKTLFAQKL